MACRTLGDCRHGAPIDREFGSMVGPTAAGEPNASVPKLFSYIRYNPELSKDGLAQLDLGHIDPADVQRLDSIDHIAQIQAVGRAYVAKEFAIGHFDGFSV